MTTFSCACVVQALTALIAATQLPSCRATPPHIVLIVADDMGWDDVGFHGSEIKTPNIDKLAYGGVILNNYYVSPICTPTRGSLMTGRHPIHLGLQHYVIAAPEPWGLPLNHTTMAQHFKRLGYATHIVGKWHLGFFREAYLPTNRGFDSHFGYWGGKEDYYNHLDIDGYSGLDFRRDLDVVNKTVYSTDVYTQETLNIITNHNQSEPLFLYLPYQAVHAGNGNDPVQAPAEYVDRFPYIANRKRRIFAGMAAALDDSVGSVFKALDHGGYLDNTIIVFTTDNGGPANNYDGNAACNVPLRGTKNTLWEGGVHGVGFVHSRLLKQRHVKSEALMHVSDWLPTLYSAAGGNVSDLGAIDGIDQWKTISENSSGARTEILHNIDPKANFSAIRVGDYKLIQGDISNFRNDMWYPCAPPAQDNDAAGMQGDTDSLYYHMQQARSTNRLKNNRWKTGSQNYGHYPPDTPYNIDCGTPPINYTTNCQPFTTPCLFNIALDPCEYNNIALENPFIVQKLLKRIEEYAATAVEPVNKPPDKRANPALYGGVWVPWEGK